MSLAALYGAHLWGASAFVSASGIGSTASFALDSSDNFPGENIYILPPGIYSFTNEGGGGSGSAEHILAAQPEDVYISSERVDLYDSLAERIGNTPLVKYEGEVPNGNTIWIKRECDNPFGSHYDRVYLHLFWHYESSGKIKPGDKILETTSGSAGVSFAGIGKMLGYECYIALPAGGEKAREEAIKRYLDSDDRLILTPAEEYVSGFPKFLKEYLSENRDFFFLNHSMGKFDKSVGNNTNNEVTLKALAGIATEAMTERRIDYFIPAVGNGSSVLGPGRIFGEGTKVVAFETFQSAATFIQMYPGRYEDLYGVKPGILSRHRLPGTSYQGIDFPHVRNAVQSGLIDDVVLVSDDKMDAEYKAMTGRDDPESLPHWDMELYNHKDIGRTTKAGVAVALEVARNVSDKNMLVIAYDKADRYDNGIKRD